MDSPKALRERERVTTDRRAPVRHTDASAWLADEHLDQRRRLLGRALVGDAVPVEE